MVQKFNLPAVMTYAYARLFNSSLLVPHYSVRNINDINVKNLKEAGIKVLVSDKDDLLTEQYVPEKSPLVAGAIEEFKKYFGNNLVVLSNHAGVWGEDPGYGLAKKVEDELGIPVFRRFWKKPWGLEKVCYEFGCAPQNIAIIDDRLSTGILGGNLCGMLTIYTLGLSIDPEKRFETGLRGRERSLLKKLIEKNVFPPLHEKFVENICSGYFL